MPFLVKHVFDTELTVGVLCGLLEAHDASTKGSLDESTIVDAVSDIFPELRKFVLRMDMGTLPRLHGLLLDLDMPDKIKAVLENISTHDKTWPNFYPFRFDLIPGLRLMLAEMRARDVPRTTRHYQDFIVHRLERYLWQGVKQEPWAHAKRFKAGCGQCRNCEKLDTFLLSDERQLQFDISAADIEHLAKRIRRLPDHSSDYTWESHSGPRIAGSPS